MSKRVILVERVNKPTFQKGGIIMKARKLISCALALILIFSTLPVFTISQAATYSQKEIKIYSKRIGDWKVMPREKWTEHDGVDYIYDSYYIVGYYANASNIKIPSKLDGKKVIGLYGDVFKGKNIKSVYIPKTIKEIEQGVFGGCKKLTKVVFEKGSKLDDISEAFKNCTALKTITLPDSVKMLHADTFSGCTSLATVNAKSLKYIGPRAFKNCKKLKNIDLSKVTELDTYAFLGCKSLKKANLKKILYLRKYAFLNCTGLESVNLSEKLFYINIGVFKGCSSLKKISVPKENTKFAVYDGALSLKNKTEIIAYPAARADKNYKIPSETKKVRYYAFYGAKKLKADLTFSDKIKSIGDYAFSGCVLVEKISVPDTIEYLGKKAFRNTAFMKAQKKNGAYYVDNILIRISGKHDEYEIKDGTVFIASHALEDCEVKTLIIPESVTKFGTNALTGSGTVDTLVINSNVDTLGDIGLEKVYSDKKATKPVKSNIKNVVVNSPITSTGTTFKETSLETISLPESVITIDDFAFRKCRNLQIFTIPKSVTTLGKYAFNESGLKEIVLTEGITKIQQSCFGKTKLEKIEIPSNIISLGQDSFKGTLLKEVVIPDTVKALGHGVFEDCKQLESVTLSNSLKKIPAYAFCDCVMLTQIQLPQSITQIGAKAFANTGIVSMVLPDSITKIDYSIFLKCKSLEYVKLPQNDTLNYISENMFALSSIKEIEIPKGYTKILSKAFYGSDLEKITLHEGLVEIHSGAFENCLNLKSIDLPESLTELGVHARYSNGRTDYDSVFRGSGIQSITIPNSVTAIGKGSFENCSKLKTAKLPDSITTIPAATFSNCKNLENVTLGNAVTIIGTKAFYRCKNLKKLSLPDTLEKIGDSDASEKTFAYSGLQSITIPKKVSTVYAKSFKGCKNLTKVTFKGQIKDMRPGTFTDCKKLETVIFEQGTAEFSQSFNNCTALKKIYIKKGTVSDINKKAFKGAKSGIKFYVNTKKQAKTLKGALEKTNIKSAKIYANNVLVYKNVG